MNNNEPPPKKKQKTGKKTSIFNTFETIPDTPKTNLSISKPQKKQTPKKHHFVMFKNNPLFFIDFCFFQHTVFVFEKLCFAENTIKIVFSGHSFSKTQLVKPTFSTMSKNTFFKEKVWFWAISAETPIFIVFPALHCFGPKKNLAKTDSCNENALFSSFLTQIASGNFG